MDLLIQMKTISKAKYRFAVRMEFGDKFLTFVTKLVLEVKTSLCFAIILLIYFYIVSFRHLLLLP